VRRCDEINSTQGASFQASQAAFQGLAVARFALNLELARATRPGGFSKFSDIIEKTLHFQPRVTVASLAMLTLTINYINKSAPRKRCSRI
jgi:hypothetical protein